MVTNEDRWFATQAALLDPRCYYMITASSGVLDITASDTWYAVNAFSVTYNDPVILAQDAYPNTRRSGFLRPLDARRSLMLPAGTRIRRNETASNDAYLYYASPSDVWSIDERYIDDPRGLYYERLARLESLPLREIIIEATGGGGIDDDLHVSVPGNEDILIVAASVYDASWATVGWHDDPAHPLNLFNEINNSHSLRTGEGLLVPVPRGHGLVFALCKGSTSDTPHSTDPAIAYPIKGTGSILYHELPSDW